VRIFGSEERYELNHAETGEEVSMKAVTKKTEKMRKKGRKKE